MGVPHHIAYKASIHLPLTVMAKVRNVVGSSNDDCKCGTWLKHWENYSNQETPDYCIVANCLEKDLVGAHVKKFDSADKNEYIIPICQKHNRSSEVLTVSDDYDLVSANVSETCG